MNCEAFNTGVLIPALAWFREHAPSIPVNRDAHVLLLAIAGQESNWTDRVQAGGHFAHGYWQFEREGGVKAVLMHPVVGPIADELCELVPVPADSIHVWGLFATEKGDNLAASFARLLLFTDPRPLPPISNEAMWTYYERNWRPGAPSRARWSEVLPQAIAAVPEEST